MSWLGKVLGTSSDSKFNPSPYAASGGDPSVIPALRAQGAQSLASAQSALASVPASEGDYLDKGTAYKAQDYSGALPQFDQARSLENQQLNQQASGARDAMDRRFAALGGGPSGAAIKSGQNLETSLGQQRDQAMAGIGIQEANTRTQLQQAEQNKVFQSQEAANQRQFAGQQSVMGRNFQRQQFQAQGAMQLAQMGFDENSKLAQLDNDFRSTQYNKELGTYQAAHQGGLLGAGGFLGSGIGA